MPDLLFSVDALNNFPGICWIQGVIIANLCMTINKIKKPSFRQALNCNYFKSELIFYFFTINFCPFSMVSDFSLFHFFKSLTVASYFSAIFASVSPFLTVW